MVKKDEAMLADTTAARRKACGYGVSTMTCATCRHVCHGDGICLRNRISVNLDRGFCRDFKFIGDCT